MSSSLRHALDEDDTTPLPRIGPPVRGRAPVRYLTPVRDSTRVIPRRDRPTLQRSHLALLALRYVAGMGALLAAGGAGGLVYFADELPEPMRVAGWTSVILFGVASLLSATAALSVYAVCAYVDRASAAANDRYEQILTMFDQVDSKLTSRPSPSVAGQPTALRLARIEDRLAVLPGMAAWAMSIDRRLGALQGGQVVKAGEGSVMEMGDAEMRAYFLGFYDRERERDAGNGG